MKKWIFWGFVFCLFPGASLASIDREALRHLPVQDAQEGRIKPFDTFAREALQLVYGRETFKKKDKIEAVDVVMMWMLWPEEWEGQELIQVRHSGLREALGLEKKIHFSPLTLIIIPNFPSSHKSYTQKNNRVKS